jgi:hypothetical protein
MAPLANIAIAEGSETKIICGRTRVEIAGIVQ